MSELTKVNGKYYLKNPNLSLTNEFAVENGEVLEVEVKVVDNRKITERQRKFIFALCNEISYETGDDKEFIRMLMQNYNANLREYEVQSLSKCNMNYANELIETIIQYCIDQKIPFARKLLEENEYRFNEKQVYTMILKRICMICGQRADIHHAKGYEVGKKGNRKEISHVGLKVLPLCRSHHIDAHKIPDFEAKNHLTPITVDDKLDYFIKKGKLRTYDSE